MALDIHGVPRIGQGTQGCSALCFSLPDHSVDIGWLGSQHMPTRWGMKTNSRLQGKFSQRGREPLSKRVNLRLTEREDAELREAAAVTDLTLSEYVKQRALGRVVVSSTDLTVVRELRRLGGLVKHVATMEIADKKAINQTLTALGNYISVLSDDRQANPQPRRER